jgi:GTP-binding protein Era
MTGIDPRRASEPANIASDPDAKDSAQATAESEFRCGFIGLAGKPNAGKSTLVNALVGDKLAIVTPKAQTTRDRILGFRTEDRYQAIFVDMPGLIEPKDRFNAALMDIAAEALSNVDLCYHLVDARDPNPAPEHVVQALRASKAPVFLVWTHVDLLKPTQDVAVLPEEVKSLYKRTFAISGTEGHGIPELIDASIPLLPDSPPLYPLEDLTDRSLRYLVAEMVREKVFLKLEQEIPYGVACEVEQYEERLDGPDYIRVTVYVERPNHKAILIGAGGSVLREIGSEARRDIERLAGKKVFLDLWVKVRKDWRKSERDLKYFGYWVEKKKRRL